MKALMGVLFVLFMSFALAAQDQPGPGSIYAAGVSYTPSASPKAAGTALFAQPVRGSGTYGFTVLDALPVKGESISKTTVVTQAAFGVAQKLMEIGPVRLYAPLAAGVSWTGENTGWSWNTGVLADIPIAKSGWGVMPNVRVLKSSVSNGAGYQLVFGVLARWGKTAQ